MKVHSVKSNAKRDARKFCAKWTMFEPAEPKAARGGGWHTALKQIGDAPAAAINSAIELAVVERWRAPKKPEPVKAPAAKAKALAVAAELLDMPHTLSTPEEVAARRQERKEQRKTAAPKAPKKRKAGKTDKLIELVSRPEGATSAELQEALGWQAHTIRGFIAGTLRKRGYDIRLEKVDGGTRYKIPPSEGLSA